jgi:hypothetical protein
VTGRWPQIRAGLVAIALVVALVDGVRPSAWLAEHLRVSEQFAIYQQPGGTHYRLWIDGQTSDGAWQLVFRAGDAEHAEDAALLESARVWGAYTPAGGGPPQYAVFCAWIGARVLAHHAEFLRVRMRLERVELDAGALIPSRQFEYTSVRGRR